MFASSPFVLTLAALAKFSLAAENIITLKSVDNVNRTVYFTGSSGQEDVDSVKVPAGATVNVTMPQGWIGNYYAVSNGKENKPGMLGEVAFNGWNDLTYFDVSAIVDPSDHEGVAEMWPATGETPTSGCRVWPCNNAYWAPDDVQTKVTNETHIITTLGISKNITHIDTADSDSEYRNVKRHFVEGSLS